MRMIDSQASLTVALSSRRDREIGCPHLGSYMKFRKLPEMERAHQVLMSFPKSCRRAAKIRVRARGRSRTQPFIAEAHLCIISICFWHREDWHNMHSVQTYELLAIATSHKAGLVFHMQSQNGNEASASLIRSGHGSKSSVRNMLSRVHTCSGIYRC